MSVVDGASGLPRLDTATRAALAAALDRDGVAAAFLFGSQARGGAGPLSDVDLALVLAPGVGASAANSIRLEVARAAGEVLGSGEVDVVVVDRASPLLRHRVARDGQLVVERDPSARIAFQVAALRDYLDTAPLRDQLRHGLRQRLSEDRFGRF